MGSCHSSTLLLSNRLLFLSDFWVQSGQQLVSADTQHTRKASETLVALSSCSAAHRRAAAFGFLLQSACFKLDKKASGNQRHLQTPHLDTGLPQH